MNFKRAYKLARGDVFYCQDERVVVTEESDHVDSSAPSTIFKFGRRELPANNCCEPRIVYLGSTGRMTHRGTYVILPKRAVVDVIATLDVDKRSAAVSRSLS